MVFLILVLLHQLDLGMQSVRSFTPHAQQSWSSMEGQKWVTDDQEHTVIV